MDVLKRFFKTRSKYQLKWLSYKLEEGNKKVINIRTKADGKFR